MTIEEKKMRKMPKGGRKGGTMFPRVSLEEALGYARKLVGKTHVSAQPRDVIFSGVVGAKSGAGNVRISALKQYGLLSGDEKVDYSATDLAKKIVSAPDDERIPLYRSAVLSPLVFRKLFETFHGDVITRMKLKQRASDLKVHPDETETCVELYISSLVTAGLVCVDGERVTHLSADETAAVETNNATDTNNAAQEEMDGMVEVIKPEGEEPTGRSPSGEAAPGGAGLEPKTEVNSEKPRGPSRQNAVFNVNVTLDSSMDIEKLQKQLELLKKYGAI
jgi:hypothetical protein